MLAKRATLACSYALHVHLECMRYAWHSMHAARYVHTAAAAHKVCIIGDRSFATHGSHGSDIYLNYRHFTTLESCCTWLHTEQHARIIGVEITDTAAAVQAHPFAPATAFMLGNEGTGLSPRQLALCDSFVYIPQHGRGTASLNVNVAAAIVLHHFASWAQLPEAPRSGFKYELEARPQRRAARGTVPLTPAEREAERARRAAAAAEPEDGSMLGTGDGARAQQMHAPPYTQRRSLIRP